MKSLKIIQVLAKIMRIICLVLFIVCIVGAAGCFLAVITLPIMKDVVLYEDKTFSIIIAERGVNWITALTGSIVGLISCGVGIFLAKYTELFFAKEIALGTPFKKEVVKDMRKMAIIHIVVSFVTVIAVAIVISSINAFNPELAHFDSGFGGTIGFGISMLVISLFCDYGAEKETEANPIVEAEPKN